jgi:transposase
MKRILVVGSSNTDMIIRVPHIPRPGETVLGGEFSMAAGGKGANQAVAAARAGSRVRFIARVGDDMFGERAVRNFEAEGIDVVLDNLNTHKADVLIEVFGKAEADRLMKRLTFHYTPLHGSWLNMAEIELSVYSRSLKKHISTEEMLVKEERALTDERNKNQTKVNWQFFTVDARIKLKQLYPSISD